MALVDLAGLAAKEVKTEKEEKKATISTHQGKDVGPFKFDYSFDRLVKGSGVPENEIPDEDELREFANAKRNASARSKKQQEVLEENGIETVSMSVKTPEGALANIVRSLIAQGRTREQAEAAAKAVLGIG